MTLKKLITSIATVALLTGTMLSMPTMAQSIEGFSSLQGVEVQALSPQDMAAIAGELNALDIAADLTALAATLDKSPRLQAAVVKLAAYYTTNAGSINDLFKRLHIFTCPRGTTAC